MDDEINKLRDGLNFIRNIAHAAILKSENPTHMAGALLEILNKTNLLLDPPPSLIKKEESK